MKTITTAEKPEKATTKSSAPAVISRRRHRPRRGGGRIIFYGILILVAFAAIFPIFGGLIGSLQTSEEIYRGSPLPGALQWTNYVQAWEGGNFKTYLPNSFFYTLVAVAGIVVASSMAGYALSRFNFRGRKFIEGLILAIMIIPAPASFIALYKLLILLNLANTRLGYVLVLIAGGLPLSIFIMRGFFARQRKELAEAAALDGCSEFTIFWRVMLPLVRPGLAAVAIIQGLYAWNEYLMALVLFTDDSLMPIQRGLTNFVSAETPQQNILLAATMISLIPILVLYAFAQKGIVQGISQGAVK